VVLAEPSSTCCLLALNLREHLCLCCLKHCSLLSTVPQLSPVATTNAPFSSVVPGFSLLWFLPNPEAHLIFSLFAHRASLSLLPEALQSLDYSTPALSRSNYQGALLFNFPRFRASLSLVLEALQSLEYRSPSLTVVTTKTLFSSVLIAPLCCASCRTQENF